MRNEDIEVPAFSQLEETEIFRKSFADDVKKRRNEELIRLDTFPEEISKDRNLETKQHPTKKILNDQIMLERKLELPQNQIDKKVKIRNLNLKLEKKVETLELGLFINLKKKIRELDGDIIIKDAEYYLSVDSSINSLHLEKFQIILEDIFDFTF